jgi:uncharacterized membrane protein (UPF0127 family)
MNPRRYNIHIVKTVLKVVLSIACYLGFTLYTVPAYNNIMAYADEKLLLNKKHVVVGEKAISVEISDTEEKRVKGLSGRENLSKDTGMLFIFDTADKHGIWMKDMKINIDIIWFNTYGEIIYFVEDVKPDSYPKAFYPNQEGKYVLEVPSGFVKKEGLKIGDKIDLY